MKFYRISYCVVTKNEVTKNKTVYLLSPLPTKKDISRYMFNTYAKYHDAFIIKDISEISLEQFAEENKENLHTMILSIIEG